jgi:hypothetical protein
MSAPCEDAPCCGCCELTADNEPPEENLDDERDDDCELARDRILDEREREDFAQDDIPEPDDELGSWNWVTD